MENQSKIGKKEKTFAETNKFKLNFDSFIYIS